MTADRGKQATVKVRVAIRSGQRSFPGMGVSERFFGAPSAAPAAPVRTGVLVPAGLFFFFFFFFVFFF